MTGTPLYSAIAVADIEHFGTRNDSAQRALRADLFAALAAALREEGIDWSAVEAKETGDGVIMLIPPSIPKIAVTRALSWRLHQELVRRTLSDPPAEEMRLRISLHGGEVNDDEFGAFGTDLNTACRLVDAQPLRDVLAAAQRSYVAVIASDSWYKAAVRHGHERIEPSAYAPLRLEVKELIETVWVHVPGLTSPPGLPPHDSARRPAATAIAGRPAASGDGVSGTHPPAAPGARSIVIHGGKFGGDIVQGDKNVNLGGTTNASGDLR